MLALFVGQICFFNLGGIWSVVYADGPTNTPTQDSSFQWKVSSRFQTVSFLQKIVYVLIYPLLILAWKLVDNSFVYWEVFWFDAVLWQLWILLRNMSNYALGFIFLYYIFKYLLSGDKKNDPKWIIVRSLIAWVWIQASWFLMVVLIDLSTILTYSIWWLPLTVLWNRPDSDSKKYDPYVLKTVFSVNSSDVDSIDTYLTTVGTWWDFYISECETANYPILSGKEELLVAPKMIYYKDEKNKYSKTENDKCHYYGQVYWFSDPLIWFEPCSSDDCKTKQDEYNEDLGNLVHGIEWSGSYTFDTVKSYIEAGRLLQIWDAHSTWWIIWMDGFNVIYPENQKYWFDKNNVWTLTWKETSRLSSVIKWDSYVWVFTSLYSSLLNAWWGIIVKKDSVYLWFLSVALAFLHMVAVAIPLIAMSIVFLMRIGVIWMAIALSPVIILLRVFELEDKVFKKDSILEALSLKNLIPIIFSPAIICFAVSMTTVIVRLIESMNYTWIASEKEPILWWLVQVNIWGMGISVWKLIVAVLWVAITWFLLRWALWLSKLWSSKFIQSLKNLSTNALSSVPIIPIPTKDGAWTVVSYWWLKKWIDSVSSNLESKLSQQDTSAIEAWLDPWKDKEKAQVAQVSSYVNALSKNIPSGANWLEMPVKLWEKWNETDFTFNGFNQNQKEEIIDAINSLKPSEREKFKWVKSIEVWDKKYVLNETGEENDKYKYVIEQAQSSQTSSWN